MTAFTVSFCSFQLWLWPPLFRPRSRRKAAPSEVAEQSVLEDTVNFPPPSPRGILTDRSAYKTKVLKGNTISPNKALIDDSLIALYRLYEFFVLDYVFGYRSQLEFFWRTPQWRLRDLPDPRDKSPARYAFLASMVQMMVEVFNKKVAYGSSRGAPAILTPEDVESMQSRPDSERDWESAPGWAEKAQALSQTLVIPAHDDRVLDSLDDRRAEPHFRSKNILLWTPHVDFT